MYTKLRDISIRNKLILMLVIISVLVLGIFFLVFIITDIRSYKERKIDSISSLAQVTGTNSLSTIQFEDQESAAKILSDLHNGEPDILHAVILDSNGKLFAAYAKPGSERLSIPPALKTKQEVFTDHHLFVSENINDGGKVVGKVVLEVELTELEEIKYFKYRVAAILLVGAVGLSFLIALAVQNYILKRLSYLVKKMTDVSRTGNYGAVIDDKGKDEISTLIHVFNRLMEQVRESQRKKDEFISIASHELKTPLTSVKGYLELLDDIEDRDPNRQFVDKALVNVGKLEKLIKDLLDVSKIQSGQMELNIREFEIDQLLGETIASIQMVSGSHEIVWKNSLKNEIIWADRQRIEQVLSNLLSNSIKYSPGKNKVIVYSGKSDSELIIKVRDFGIGILPEERSSIFERFYRTKNNEMAIPGFGLGLYICKDIIKRHDGNIWVESEEIGSAFCFTLPLKKHQSQSLLFSDDRIC